MPVKIYIDSRYFYPNILRGGGGFGVTFGGGGASKFVQLGVSGLAKMFVYFDGEGELQVGGLIRTKHVVVVICRQVFILTNINY